MNIVHVRSIMSCHLLIEMRKFKQYKHLHQLQNMPAQFRKTHQLPKLFERCANIYDVLEGKCMPMNIAKAQIKLAKVYNFYRT